MPVGVLWYAGERGLPGGLGREPDGAEHHEDGSVAVHHRRRCPAAAGAGGAPALSVGGTLPQGESDGLHTPTPLQVESRRLSSNHKPLTNKMLLL